MEKQLRGKVFSTFLMMCICVAVMVVLWHFTPAKATDTETPSFTPEQTVTETPAAESPQPTESVEPTETPSQEPTETPEETASPEGTEALPENTFCFACEFIEEERNTSKEHHNTMHNCVEEKESNFCVKTLNRVWHKVGWLNITDN